MFTLMRLPRSSHSFEFWIMIGCLIWFMCVPTAMAQQYYGGLTGTITDSTGAVLAGVTVKVTNLSKGTVTRVVSNDVGIFRAANLLPDTYKVEAELAGFKKFGRQPLLVEANRTLTLDIRMEVGEITETVDVSDAPPILETESATTTNTIEGSLVIRLPVAVASRNDLKSTVGKLPGSVSANQVSINGARGAQTSWDVDGLPNRGPNGGGMMEEHSINYESVKSWKYTLVNANAESPSPTQISLLTRSGSNDFHGSLYWDTHHSAFDAPPHAVPEGFQKPFSRHNWEGLHLSGPVYIPKLYDGRNRTFFMFTLELNQAPTRGASLFTTPTEAMRRGDFSDFRDPSGELITIKDPMTNQPFPGNKIPVERLYPGALRFFEKFYPLPNVSTPLFNNNAYVEDFVNYNISSRRADLRFDQAISSKNKFFFRYFRFWNPSSQYYTFFVSGPNQSNWHFDQYQFTDTHTFGPSLLNEFRFGINQIVNTQRVGAQAKALLDLLGIQGVPEVLYSGNITGLPALNITGITGYGQFSHSNSQQRLWDVFDNVTLQRKRHSIKFGVNIRKDIIYNLSWPKPGSFAFTGVFTGFGLADFLLGLPLSSVRDYPRAALGPEQRVGWYTGAYLQDDFKLSPRLTLNFGLRWDVNFPAREIHDLYSGFDPKTGNLVVPSQEAIGKVVPTFPQAITLVTAAQAGFPERLRRTDWNNFAPRIGIAWRPFDEKTVIRSGYGIYNDNLSLGYLNTGSPWGGNETFMNRIENGVPLWQLPAAFPAGVVGERPGTISINALDPNIKNPYVQQWNLTVERQIEAMVIRLQYVGTKSTHLYWYPNLNLPEPSTIPFSDSRRPYPQYRDITYRTNGGDSIYHAMTLGAERRLRHGITFNSYWTWAKALTDSYDGGGEKTDLTAAGYLGFWFPTFDRRRWRGNEQYVPRHRWTTTWFAELPFGRDKHFGSQWSPLIDFVAGGWALSGIVDALTGWYVSPYYTGGTDPASIGVNSGPPDRIASGLRPINELKPGGQFLDPTAFVIPSSNIGRFGNAGINFIQSPGSWSFDVGLQKAFPIRERLHFEFLCKILNVLNHAGFDYQYGLYGGLDLSNLATFGSQVRSVSGNRQIGFIGRLTW